MKTTLELPSHLMREVKIRAAKTDRKLKDVVTELIQRGLANSASAGLGKARGSATRQPDALDQLFEAGDDLANSGVDIAAWAASSRKVWR